MEALLDAELRAASQKLLDLYRSSACGAIERQPLVTREVIEPANSNLSAELRGSIRSHMPNVATVLREEIQRLARKEAKAQIAALKKHRAVDRKAIAGPRRHVAALERDVASLKNQERRRVGKTPEAANGTTVRFSPKWVAADRARLGLSAKDYGLLVGVSMLTIYNWEKGTSKPQAKQRAAWAGVRGIGKREAWQRLESLDEQY